MLGVRIDVFSSLKRRFEVPYFVLLNQPEGEGGRLRVHKHTVPVCVPVEALGERFLPYAPGGGEEGDQRPQDVGRFLRAVRRECVCLRKRVEALDILKAELGRARGVVGVRVLDGEGREAEIEFVDKYVARVSVDTDGTIGKVVVRNGSRGSGASVRGKTIERVILGGDGRIETLTARLSDGLDR